MIGKIVSWQAAIHFVTLLLTTGKMKLLEFTQLNLNYNTMQNVGYKNIC
jgi:hypothetical protein